MSVEVKWIKDVIIQNGVGRAGAPARQRGQPPPWAPLQSGALDGPSPWGAKASGVWGDPAGPSFADAGLDAGLVLEPASKDHRHKHVRHIHREGGDPGGAGGERHLGGGFGEVAPNAAAD